MEAQPVISHMIRVYECFKDLFGNPIVSVSTGAAITWLFAWHYYKKAGDELKAEAFRLRRTTEIILRWLEARGEDVEVIRQPNGTPTGLAHDAKFVSSASVVGSFDVEVIRGSNSDSTP